VELTDQTTPDSQFNWQVRNPKDFLFKFKLCHRLDLQTFYTRRRLGVDTNSVSIIEFGVGFMLFVQGVEPECSIADKVFAQTEMSS